MESVFYLGGIVLSEVISEYLQVFERHGGEVVLIQETVGQLELRVVLSGVVLL